jgi:hypothetical protein
MAKEKLTLSELKVESCVTSLTGDQLDKVKGGMAIVHGRRNSYRIRWTAVDTRAQTDFTGVEIAPNTGGRG